MERRKRTRKRSSGRKLGLPRLLVVLCLTVALLVFFTGLGFSVGIIQAIPNLDGSGLDNYAISSVVYDREGNIVAKLHGEENRIPVSLEEMSPHFIDAVLAIEDQRFYSHFGVDPIRIAGAMVANIKSGRIVQGGSTITQQLVGLSKLDRTEKSYKRKIQEALLAIKVEREYEKDQILEFYLNRAYFGHSAYGVEAAAQTYFGKHAKDLNIQEAAMLAGIIQNPYKHSPLRNMEAAKERRAVVLNAMVDFGKLTTEEAAKLKETPIEVSKSTPKKSSYNYQSFVDYVVDQAIEKLKLSDEETRRIYTSGYKIYTTLDTKIQSKMEQVYANDANFPQGKGGDLIQSAMVVIDHRTGEIRGIVGGRNQEGQRVFNRATQATRQPGSAFKPIVVFGPAIEMGYSPATVQDDFPVAYESPSGPWVPKNYDGQYRGLISMRTAAQYSVNVWSVKMLQEIGVEAGFNFAQRLGISTLVPEGKANDKGLALALGGLTKGVTPLEMAAAYGAFANGGVYIESYAITKIEDKDGKVLWENKVRPEQVMSPETAYLVTNMLQTAVEAGTGTKAQLANRSVAGKTGTTSDTKDAWFIGYTPEFVGAVWLGYDNPKEMSNVIGGGYNAGPIWKQVMETAHDGLPGSTFARPENIVEVAIDTKSGLLPGPLTPPNFIKTELFNSSHVPTTHSMVWEQRRICFETGQLATEFCPLTQVQTLLVRSKPWSVEGLPENLQNAVPADASLEGPRESCSLHSGQLSIGLPEIFINGD